MRSAHSSSKLKGALWVAVALAMGGGAALGVPFAARHVPWSVEKRLAALQHGLPEIVPCEGRSQKEALALFDRIVRRIYPVYPSDKEFPVTVRLVRGNTVNAFAFLGGEIYVHEGLLKQAESPEEMAGVIAHEIEHVKRRHIMQGVFVRLATTGALKVVFSGHGAADPKLGSMLLNMRFSREQEREADEGALRRLQEARVDVSGFGSFFKRAENMSSIPTILSDHPASDSRARLAAEFRTPHPEPIMTRAEWGLVKTLCR